MNKRIERLLKNVKKEMKKLKNDGAKCKIVGFSIENENGLSKGEVRVEVVGLTPNKYINTYTWDDKTNILFTVIKE